MSEDRALARYYAERALVRRTVLTAAKVCINGWNHGPPAWGTSKCAWCHAVHKRGVLAVLTDPAAPPRPPGYRPRLRVTALP